MYAHLPLDLWLGRGLPLHPNVKGVIINYLRHELRPRELAPPEPKIFSNGSSGCRVGYVMLVGTPLPLAIRMPP